MEPTLIVANNGMKITLRKKWKIVNLEELEQLQDVSDQFFYVIGQFGKWQLLKCVYVLFVLFIPLSFHTLNMVFFR